MAFNMKMIIRDLDDDWGYPPETSKYPESSYDPSDPRDCPFSQGGMRDEQHLAGALAAAFC